MNMDEILRYYSGIPIVVAERTMKVRNKTHKWKLIDRLYEKIYGWSEIKQSYMAEDTMAVIMNTESGPVIYVRDEKVVEMISDQMLKDAVDRVVGEPKSEKKRTVTSDEDCADCLCRVCARNRCNDSLNSKLENGYANCECNCNIGDILIETEEDCPDFLPDEDI